MLSHHEKTFAAVYLNPNNSRGGPVYTVFSYSLFVPLGWQIPMTNVQTDLLSSLSNCQSSVAVLDGTCIGFNGQ